MNSPVMSAPFAKSTLRTLSDRSLMLIIVLAVLARIASAAVLGDSLFFDDETVYLDAAENLVEKGEFDRS